MDYIEGIKLFLYIVELLFITYLIGYSTFIFLSVVIGSIKLYANKQLETLKNKDNTVYDIPVSIIIPAYNESTTVVDTVRSLLMLDYNSYEIIVVDDGSKDETKKSVIEYFNLQKEKIKINYEIKCNKAKEIYSSNEYKVPIKLISKNNGGKADSLNLGINVLNYPYFICIDADSILQRDALKKIVRPIIDNNDVVAVGGFVRLGNEIQFKECMPVNVKIPNNILAAMQVLEYDRSFLAARILFDQFNGNLIISGAFGLFKKDIVLASGGYDAKTMGEDMELVVKMHVFCKANNINYSIKYAYDAICWSQAPVKLKELAKQRRRWYIGLIQTMKKHRDNLLFNVKYGPVSTISYFYFLIYELLSPFIEIFGLITTLIAFSMNLINVPFMIMFFLIYAVFGAILSLTAFLARIYIENSKITVMDFLKAILLCLFEITVLRFILSFTRLSAVFGYKKKEQDWGEIKRFKMLMT